MKNVVSGTVYGSIDDPRLTYSGNVKMWAGSNTISILSVSVGLPVSQSIKSSNSIQLQDTSL
jgi:hypothetical protein